MVSYHSSINQHGIKQHQEITILKLGLFRIRLDTNPSNQSSVENTPTNGSVLSIENGIRTYRHCSESDLEWNSYHQLPQIVCFLLFM